MKHTDARHVELTGGHGRLTLGMVMLVHALAIPVAAQTYQGALEDGDARLENTNKLMDSYTVGVAEGQHVVVTMTSDSLDTYLIVTSPSGEATENDDFGPGTSQVQLVAAEAGAWTITATSYSAGETGAYELTVDLGAVASVEVVEGRLDNRDAVSIKGEYYDTHTVSVSPGVNVYIELVSLGFDGYLSVTTPSGQSYRNDDAGSIELSRVGPLVAEEGPYTVYVTSVGAEEVGAYDLRILTFE